MSADLKRKKNSFKKAEIIRGRNSFASSFENTNSVSSNHLRIYIKETNNPENNYNLDTRQSQIKVGFVVSKKKLKSAVRRNKAKRILRETYRLAKYNAYNLLGNKNLIMILSYTDKGYSLFNLKVSPVAEKLDKELETLLIDLKGKL